MITDRVTARVGSAAHGAPRRGKCRARGLGSPQDISQIEIRKIAPSLVNVVEVALVSEDAPYRELEDHLSEDEAERVIETAINWARHAELFAYDADTETLSLDNP